MESTITIEKLVKRASELQLKALALTDEHVLYGAVPFYKACQQYGIKPLIGMVVYIRNPEQDREQCILLAKNNQGYENLIKLSTHMQMEKKECIEIEELRSFTHDLLCVFPVIHSKLETLLDDTSHDEAKTYVQALQALFAQGDFYLGIQDHGLDKERRLHKSLKAFHQTQHIPVVAINDVRYIHEKDDIAY